jgi:hypothetical protein
MARDRHTVVAALVDDLTPVTPHASLVGPAAAWWVISWLWVIAATLAYGPLRPGALAALGSVPHFAAESLLGLLAGLLITWIGFAESVPGMARRSLALLAVAIGGLWVTSYLAGFVVPALEPSMAGKRPHCFFETLVYALPPIVVGVWMLRRRYALRAVRAGALIGLAAGSLPALLMQVACMYSPEHILLFHIGPGLAMGVVGAAAGAWLARPSVAT